MQYDWTYCTQLPVERPERSGQDGIVSAFWLRSGGARALQQLRGLIRARRALPRGRAGRHRPAAGRPRGLPPTPWAGRPATEDKEDFAERGLAGQDPAESDRRIGAPEGDRCLAWQDAGQRPLALVDGTNF